jgi:predicted Zn-dependent peptidase
MTLVVVGDFDTETALAKIAVRFAQYKRQIIKPHSFREMPIKPGVTVVTEERDVAKSHFLFAFEGPKMSSPDYLPIEVLMHYVGGDSPTVPLRDTLIQERAILQKLSASPLRRKFGRGWQPFIGEGEPKNITAGIDGLLEILDQVRARGVSREDLALVKKRLASAHRQAMTNGLKYATALAESDAHGDYRLIAEYEDRIGRVTTKDVWTVARKYFRPERFFLMAVFPRGKTPTKFADDVKRTAGHYAGLPKNGVV